MEGGWFTVKLSNQKSNFSFKILVYIFKAKSETNNSGFSLHPHPSKKVKCAPQTAPQQLFSSPTSLIKPSNLWKAAEFSHAELPYFLLHNPPPHFEHGAFDRQKPPAS